MPNEQHEMSITHLAAVQLKGHDSTVSEKNKHSLWNRFSMSQAFVVN